MHTKWHLIKMNFTSPVEAESVSARDALCISMTPRDLIKFSSCSWTWIYKKRETASSSSRADKDRIIVRTWLNFKVN